MNILFITLSNIQNILQRGIYEDLLREFVNKGHNVYVVCPSERRDKSKTYVISEKRIKILRVKTGNIQKTNIIEKGISTLMLEIQFKRAIKKFFKNIRFDLVLYSTPPITVLKSVEFIKKRDKAITYLLLKDIFPQNAVDIGMMRKTGIQGLLYNFFRNKEKKLYAISDYIGCMSQANVEYILKNNPEIEKEKVEVCPNSIKPKDLSKSGIEKIAIRHKYEIPDDKMIFVYGGNLGKPQGISFLIDCLKNQSKNKDVFFLIIGSGTEFGTIEKFIKKDMPENVKLIKKLPKDEYDQIVGSCDIGMLFLDHRFTIPNFPSRLLGYMEAKMPVLAVTDPNTDVGKIIVEGQFGWWCESDNVNTFAKMIKKILDTDISLMKENAYEFLLKNYSVSKCYTIIVEKIKG